MRLSTLSLILEPQTRAGALAAIQALSPEDRRQVSPQWLEQLETSAEIDPWIHGFVVVLRQNGIRVGQCGFTGPWTSEGVVEIAYGIDPAFQRKGFATEAAAALVSFAFSHPQVKRVCAHTLPEPNASTRVLQKCGFVRTGESLDHEAGVVWKWEKSRLQADATS